MTEDNVLIIAEDSPHQNRWDFLRSRWPSLSNWGLARLKEGLDAYARTIVVEPRYICKDHRNLHSNFYSKKFRERSPTCIRLHFFSKAGLTQKQLGFDLSSLQADYVGYAVIRPVSERCLGRTVIDPYMVGRNIKNGFYTLRTGFKSHVNGAPLKAWGYPYMSQDREATVCAHTALWGLCRYLSERYTAYPELYPYDLINLTSDTEGRTVPYRGMTYSDYSRILVNFGCHPKILFRDGIQNSSAQMFLDLSAYVESGFPVLASFAGHVVTIVGHTMDRSKSPTPDINGFINSSAFLKQFIVVDDNFFPYQLLGTKTDPENYGTAYPTPYYIDSIRVAVCPLPEKVYLPAIEARKQFTSILKSFLQRPAIETQLRKDKNTPLVMRQFLTTSSAFKRRKLEKASQNQPPDPLALRVCELHLPHFIWVMEIAPEVDYLTGQCTGEIVLDATANSMEDSLLYARTGEILLLNDRQLHATNYLFNLKTFPQYTHNLGEL